MCTCDDYQRLVQQVQIQYLEETEWQIKRCQANYIRNTILMTQGHICELVDRSESGQMCGTNEETVDINTNVTCNEIPWKQPHWLKIITRADSKVTYTAQYQKTAQSTLHFLPWQKYSSSTSPSPCCNYYLRLLHHLFFHVQCNAVGMYNTILTAKGHFWHRFLSPDRVVLLLIINL